MAQHQEWMSIEEVAAELKISTEAVRKLIETGKVAAVTAGDEVRVRASALDRFARRAERGAGGGAPSPWEAWPPPPWLPRSRSLPTRRSPGRWCPGRSPIAGPSS
jgi:excisionase family DNA binding protein